MFAARQAAAGALVALIFVAGTHSGVSEAGQPPVYPAFAAQKGFTVLCREITASAARFFDGAYAVIGMTALPHPHERD